MSYTISLYFRDGTVTDDETSFEYAAVAERSARAIQQTFIRAFDRGDIQYSDLPFIWVDSKDDDWSLFIS